MNVRALAALVLAPILRGEGSLQSSFDAKLTEVEAKDKSLLHELVLGTLRRFELLDDIAATLLDKKPKAKDQDIYALILLGLYQIEYMRVPDHAAISETVNAAKQLKKVWAKNLINAVLRNYQREAESLLKQATAKEHARYLMPKWLLKELKRQWPHNWQDICLQTAEKPPLTARINLNKRSLDDTVSAIEEQGLNAKACPFSNRGLQITGSKDIEQLPGFNDGWLSIQDEAAQLASELMELAPGQRVLDACAAPGGKTGALLESERSLTELVALELDQKRSEKISENLDRLKLQATIVCADAVMLEDWWDGTPFDRILLDAPCTATGVIRRNPDIKLLRRANDVAELAALQKLMLNTLWQTLKPGGKLVYATCSILKAENEHQIANFIYEHSDASEQLISADWGVPCKRGRQLFPQADGHDGFYYAKLIKAG